MLYSEYTYIATHNSQVLLKYLCFEDVTPSLEDT